MHLSENEGIEGKRFVVTGGLGFVGSALCLELVRRGAEEVRSLDPRPSSPWSIDLRKGGVRLLQGDVSRKKDVEKALRGADCVFHLASYGMSGKEMLQARRIDEVNINGTCNILDVCHEVGIKRLVYVSTYNVVFGGKEIMNGNEALQYFPIDDHVDPYGRSKSVAEQLVLKCNGRPSKKKDGARLYTCAIRPAAIYGPGEERHLPRIVSLAKMGLARFKVGDASVKTDWVYVDNLVLALILASMGLLDDIPGRKGRPVSAGQPYFISDGSPVNSFEFIVSPLLQSLDYDLPMLTLDVKHALLMSRVFWFAYTMMYPWLNRRWLPAPLLLPAEVYKTSSACFFASSLAFSLAFSLARMSSSPSRSATSPPPTTVTAPASTTPPAVTVAGVTVPASTTPPAVTVAGVTVPASITPLPTTTTAPGPVSAAEVSYACARCRKMLRLRDLEWMPSTYPEVWDLLCWDCILSYDSD